MGNLLRVLTCRALLVVHIYFANGFAFHKPITFFIVGFKWGRLCINIVAVTLGGSQILRFTTLCWIYVFCRIWFIDAQRPWWSIFFCLWDPITFKRFLYQKLWVIRCFVQIAALHMLLAIGLCWVVESRHILIVLLKTWQLSFLRLGYIIAWSWLRVIFLFDFR